MCNWASRTRDLDVTDAKTASLTCFLGTGVCGMQERLGTRERRDRGDKQSTPKRQNGESGTFSRAKNDTWGKYYLRTE